MQGRMSALETAVDDAVYHGLQTVCVSMLREIVFRTHLDVFRRAVLGDPLARVEPMTVRLQSVQGRCKRSRVHPRQPRRLGCTNTWPTWNQPE